MTMGAGKKWNNYSGVIFPDRETERQTHTVVPLFSKE